MDIDLSIAFRSLESAEENLTGPRSRFVVTSWQRRKGIRCMRKSSVSSRLVILAFSLRGIDSVVLLLQVGLAWLAQYRRGDLFGCGRWRGFLSTMTSSLTNTNANQSSIG